MLNIIKGRLGEGKTAYMQEIAVKESLNGKTVLYLVPPQYSVVTQRGILDKTNDSGKEVSSGIFVSSIKLIAADIYKKIYGDSAYAKVLDDYGYAALTRSILINLADTEKLGKHSLLAKRKGYQDQMIDFLMSLAEQGKTAENLLSLSESGSAIPLPIKEKIQCAQIIEKEVQNWCVQNQLITKSSFYSSVITAVPYYKWQETLVIVDGYAELSFRQTQLIEAISRVTDVYITIPVIRMAGETEESFSFSNNGNLKTRQVEIPWSDVSLPPMRLRGREDLCLLESMLFTGTKFSSVPKNICASAYPTKEEEVWGIAKKITELINNGSRYKQIAVMVPDLARYSDVFERVMEQAGIPYFMDMRYDLNSVPVISFIVSYLSACSTDCNEDSITRLLSSGMLPVGRREIRHLRAFLGTRMVRGYETWRKEWRKSKKTPEWIDIEAVNKARKAVSDILDTGIALSRENHTVDEYLADLTAVLKRIEAGRKMEVYYERIKEEDSSYSKTRASVFRQVMPEMSVKLSNLSSLIGTMEISIQQFLILIHNQMESVQAAVGVIPQTVDQILIGDYKRSRVNGICYMFAAGLSRSEDSAKVSNMFISPAESSIFFGGMELSAKAEEMKNVLDRITSDDTKINSYILTNLCKPLNKTFISWNTEKDSGPNIIARGVLDMFPKLSVSYDGGQPNTKHELLSKIADGTRSIMVTKKIQNGFFELCKAAKLAGYEKELERIILQTGWSYGQENINEGIAKMLYTRGGSISMGITTIEKYNRCAYWQLMTQCGVTVPAKNELEIVDIGNILHECFENVTKSIVENGRSFSSLEQNEIIALADSATRNAVEAYKDGLLAISARAAYSPFLLRRHLETTLIYIAEQMKMGRFTESIPEVEFSTDSFSNLSINLPDGTPIILKGKIDRIDTAMENETLYVRAIDYKSGEKTFSMSAIADGTQLQLSLYAQAAVEIMQERTENVIPAGMYYSRIKDAVVSMEADPQSDEALSSEMLKAYVLSGITNSNETALALTDSETLNGYSPVSGVSIKKGIGCGSKILSTEEFGKLFKATKDVIKQSVGQMLKGKFPAMPNGKGEKSACRLCPYHRICGMDESLPGCGHKRTQLSEAEARDYLLGEDEE